MLLFQWRNPLRRLFPSPRARKYPFRYADRLSRFARLRLEVLEARTLLSASVPAPPSDSTSAPAVDLSTIVASPLASPSPIAHPPHIIYQPPGGQPYANPTPLASSFTPQQIRKAYGIDLLYGLVGDGTGQTIAIVDAYDDPSFVNSTDPNFNTSDLHMFDVQYGLPDPPSFLKLGQTGTSTLPSTDPAKGWEGEEALDVEWAHAIAPGANIILFEANDASLANLFTAVQAAANYPGVSVVSMSFGADEFNGEQTLDNTFTTPAGHQGVTFVASAGDSGAPGGYPAYSPNVVAVGGTALTLNPDNSYKSETTWNNGAGGGSFVGTGGGTSQFESEPSYQQTVQNSGKREMPDVAFVADPNTGVAVYDSFTNGAGTPWDQIGGTSLSAPCWSGLFAIANQGLARLGRPSLDGRNQTLPDLYALFQTTPSDFHDITTGSNNGFNAGPGYDETTGLGSPAANLLIPDLIGMQVQMLPISATEGQPLTLVPVANFQAQAGAATGNFQATIFWGDGSSSPGTIRSIGGGLFTVLGTHTYVNAGNYTLTVNVVDKTHNRTGLGSETVTVGDAPLVGIPAPPLSSQTGGFLSNVEVAGFTDTDPTLRSAGNYTATVTFFQDNGLFSTTTGDIVANGVNSFLVFASNPVSYASGGTYIVRTVIRDAGGATVTVDTTVNVAGKPALGPTSPIFPAFSADTSTVNKPFILMEEALTNLLQAQTLLFASFGATFPVQMQALSNFLFAEVEYELAVLRFDMTLPFGG